MIIVKNLVKLEIILRKDNALRENKILYWTLTCGRFDIICQYDQKKKTFEWQSLLNLKCHQNMKDSDI